MKALLDTLIDSRKWKLALIGLAMVFIGTPLGIPEERVSDGVDILMALIVGQGVVDAGKAVATKAP